jgi:N,N'-diacetyllegionaminate synthase
MSALNPVIQIADWEIRQGGRPFLIADVAQAHDGSLGFAHSFIEVVAEAGFDAIKFQTHIAEAESTRDESFRVPFGYEDATRFDYWRRMEFTPYQWQGLADHARQRSLVFLSSCFSVQAVNMMRELGIQAWKVGSGDLEFDALLDVMASGEEPLLLSTGLSGFVAIERQVARLSARNVPIALFQCTTRYPAAHEQVGLNVIDQLHNRFGCPVGLSDHCGSIWPAVAAMARGAPLIEVHVAFHRRQFGPDAQASLVPAQLGQLVEARNAICAMTLNPVDKEAMREQLGDVRKLFGRSLTLRDALPAGTVLLQEHLTMKKPGGGLQIGDLPSVLGRKLRHDLSSDRLLRLDDLEPSLG